MKEKTQHTITKPRSGFIAFLLSLVTPGLGQIYNGQPKRGIVFFILLLSFPLVLGLIRLTTSFYGLVVLLVIYLIIHISVIVDAILQAKRQKDYQPKKYNTWYYLLFIAIGMLTVWWFYHTASVPVLGTQTFVIPTNSQLPTIQVGDYVVVDKQYYNNEKLDYGHIVVFQRPKGESWSFRIVGLPNDKLEIVDNMVTINGIPSKYMLIGETFFDGTPVTEFEEELPNGHRHRIYKYKQLNTSTKTTLKDIIVPSDNYYLLGDNRDDAKDSRYIGTVSRNKILGRVIYSFWGQSTDRINIDFRDK
jgi:signal peptidase I